MIGSVTYSDVLATIALLVSLGTAGWTGYRAARWDRPVVKVTGTAWVGAWAPDLSAVRVGFTTEISNTGNETTQISDSFWELDLGTKAHVRIRAGAVGIESLFDDAPPGEQPPAMPFDLAKHQHRVWEFDAPAEGVTDPHHLQRMRPVAEFSSRRGRRLAYGSWVELPEDDTVAAGTSRHRHARS